MGANYGEFGNGMAAPAGSYFHSMQNNVGVGYHPESVLAPLRINSGNGLGTSDRSRINAGGLFKTNNGQSQTTYDKSLWLTSPYRSFG
jgi:hypothetical protein